MARNKKNRNVINSLGYAYIRKIKRWMFCPSCQSGKLRIDKKRQLWICNECGYELSVTDFENDYIFWFCDECNDYLNAQNGFDYSAKKHICRNCGYENDITLENIKGVCIDCGKVIEEKDGNICVECRSIRKKKAKDTIATIGGIAVAVTSAAISVEKVKCRTNEVDNTGRNLDFNDSYEIVNRGAHEVSEDEFDELVEGNYDDVVFLEYDEHTGIIRENGCVDLDNEDEAIIGKEFINNLIDSGKDIAWGRNDDLNINYEFTRWNSKK